MDLIGGSEHMAEIILEFMAGFLISVMWWLVLFPVVWLVSTPFILLIAAFRRRPYSLAVLELFGSVHHFWKEWGIVFVS